MEVARLEVARLEVARLEVARASLPAAFRIGQPPPARMPAPLPTAALHTKAASRFTVLLDNEALFSLCLHASPRYAIYEEFFSLEVF
jgi:hypothetical protein